MKFPYGICDFYQIITEDYVYVDRTDYIPTIEQAGKHLLFLRSRRFGKSLLLSTLENLTLIVCVEIQNDDYADDPIRILAIQDAWRGQNM